MIKDGSRIKFTAAQAKAYCDAIRRGIPRIIACRALGVGRNMVYDYLAWATTLRERGGPYNKREQIMVDLLNGIEQAEADFVDKCMAAIVDAGTRPESPQWQAVAWALERCYPMHYGNRQQQDINITTDKPDTVRSVLLDMAKRASDAEPDTE